MTINIKKVNQMQKKDVFLILRYLHKTNFVIGKHCFRASRKNLIRILPTV